MSSSRISNHQGSSTAVIELQPVHIPQGAPEKQLPIGFSRRLGPDDFDDDLDRSDQNETLPPPTAAPQETLEAWNSPRSNLYRTLAAFWGFAIMGMNDVR
jgi:hypothetical protein